MAKQPQRDPARFTDVNIGYSVDPEDKRTDKEVLKDMEKLGIEIVHASKRPPEAY